MSGTAAASLTDPAGNGRWAGIRRRFLRESELIRHYLGEYRGYFGLGILTLVGVDLLEVLPPILMKKTLDGIMEGAGRIFLIQMALWYLAVAVGQAIFRYGWRRYLIMTSLFAGRDLRNRFADHLYGLSASFFDRRKVGDLMALATSDTEAVRMAIGNGVLILADAVFYFLTLPVAMWWLSPKLTLLSFAFLPIIPFVVFRNDREMDRRYRESQECLSRLSALVQEGIAGVRVIKSFAREETLLGRLRERGEELVRLNLSLARVQVAFGPSLDFMMSAGLALILWWGGQELIRGEVAGAGAVTLGTFVAFQRYIQKMAWPMAAVGLAVGFFQRGFSSTRRLNEVLDRRSDVMDSPEAAGQPGPRKMTGVMEFRDLRFQYPGTDRPILRGVSFRVERGMRLGLIGTVGCGKSTLLSLIPRLYPVERGQLFIDEVDINDWRLEDLRTQIGYVAQNVFLFSDSVAENIAFGLHGRLASEVDPSLLEEASTHAAVHEDVLDFSGRYQTRLGELGVNISGGQKQRLTLARALVRKPEILILDDALSAVDVTTEAGILKGLRERKGRNTEIFCSHRVATFKDCDQILVMGAGRIIESGTHSELLRMGDGTYRRFHDQQKLQEDLEQYLSGIGEGPDGASR